MTCEELRPNFELYALGIAEPQERDEIEAHLGRDCRICAAAFRDALATNAMLLSLTPAVKPPARLRRRVMASVGVERATYWAWLPGLAAAAMLAIALWLGSEERARTVELAQARRDILRVGAERDRLAQAVSFLNEADTRQVNFGRGKPAPPRGNVLLNPRLGILLIASNLPTLPAGKTYQMWVIPKGGSPRPAGLFQAGPNATGFHLVPGSFDATNLGAIAVSVEPESGSGAPTTTPIIVAPVSGA